MRRASSRLLGLGRESVQAAALGTSGLADVAVLMLTLPDWLTGVAASGALATRMGLSGVPVAAETIALHTIFELVRSTRTRVHLCRLSSAAGVYLAERN
mgnify:CR=1 FL=1